LQPADQRTPDVALAAARKLMELQGEPSQARTWLLPVWEQFLQAPQSLSGAQAQRLFVNLQHALDELDADWLARIESAQRAAPQEPRLQYLAGMACVQRQLWGKGEQLLQSAVGRLSDAPLRASAWKALAIMAEQREDTAAAAKAWREAALQALSK
jgi:HemY protein